MTEAREGLDQWLRRLRTRSDISASEAAKILALPGSINSYRANATIVSLGTKVSHVDLVIDGVSGQFAMTRSGERQIVALHLPGEMANLPSVILPSACCAQVALGATKMLRIPHSAIVDLVRVSPNLAAALWRESAVDAAITERLLVVTSRLGAEQRLAHLLCELAIRLETVSGSRLLFATNMTQVQMADVIGMTAVHLNRVAQNLRAAGLIRWSNNSVRILDWPTLTALGEFDPSYLHLCDDHAIAVSKSDLKAEATENVGLT